MELLVQSTTKKADAQTQTPVHFTESNKDPKYTWNEWELRRQAIKTVKHLQCRSDIFER